MTRDWATLVYNLESRPHPSVTHVLGMVGAVEPVQGEDVSLSPVPVDLVQGLFGGPPGEGVLAVSRLQGGVHGSPVDAHKRQEKQQSAAQHGGDPVTQR